MALELTVVDVFTDAPFRGNPAAVGILEGYPDDNRLQAVAREMNLSETAFVVRRPDGDHDLRWFSPAVEIDFCGHATLAAAHLMGGAARFHTRSGVLTCSSAGGWIEMEASADPTTPASPPAALELPGLRWFGYAREDALAELDRAALVRELRPDLAAISALGTRALIVTAAGDRPGIDCVSRVFGPNVGIPEDPATGSAHCTLAGYWGERLGLDDLVGEQASARGGTVRMHRRGDRVAIAGQAVMTAQVRLVA